GSAGDVFPVQGSIWVFRFRLWRALAVVVADDFPLSCSDRVPGIFFGVLIFWVGGHGLGVDEHPQLRRGDLIKSHFVGAADLAGITLNGVFGIDGNVLVSLVIEVLKRPRLRRADITRVRLIVPEP